MLAASAFVAALLCASGDGWQDLAPSDLPAVLQTSAASRPVQGGVELEVAPRGASLAVLRPGARALEVTLQTDGLFLITWAAMQAPGGKLYGPPWRYASLQPGTTTLRFNFFLTADWSATTVPVLFFDGAGRITVTAIRVLPAPVDAAAAATERDREWRSGPESFGHTTINFVAPPKWSVTENTPLSRVFAVLFLGAALVALFGARIRAGRWDPRAALALGALAALGFSTAHFCAGAWPALNLAFPGDAEERLKRGFAYAPELGAAAADARSVLGPAERVGVLARDDDWFTAQTLCLQLAPRPCVRVTPGATDHAGISGVARLRGDELDAIVSFLGPESLPPGFGAVHRVTHRAVIGRRP